MDNHCHSCGASCSTCEFEPEPLCPECGQAGLEVPYETAAGLIKTEFKEKIDELSGAEVYLCTNRACRTAYYTDYFSFSIHDIKVPIWFKHEKDEYMICYCRRITLDDVKDAVNFLDGEITVSRVIEYLGKADVQIDCLHNNPTGLPCDRLFENAIQYALKQKNNNRK